MMDDRFLKSLKSTQELDQAMAAIKMCAQLVRAYNESLRSEGFGKAEALHLTLGYQTSLMVMAQSNQNGGQS